MDMKRSLNHCEVVLGLMMPVSLLLINISMNRVLLLADISVHNRTQRHHHLVYELLNLDFIPFSRASHDGAPVVSGVSLEMKLLVLHLEMTKCFHFL